MTTTTTSSDYRLDVEAFSLSNGGRTVHYEADGDLFVNCHRAIGSGQRAGLVLVELGIDGYDAHRVGVGVYPIDDPTAECTYEDRADALAAAARALEAIAGQLRAMQTEAEARAAERNAFEIGRDKGREEGGSAAA